MFGMGTEKERTSQGAAQPTKYKEEERRHKNDMISVNNEDVVMMIEEDADIKGGELGGNRLLYVLLLLCLVLFKCANATGTAVHCQWPASGTGSGNFTHENNTRTHIITTTSLTPHTLFPR